jgi:signal peptidase I
MSAPVSSRPQAAHSADVYPGGALPAIQSLLYLIVVAVFIITFAVQPFRIPSGSMEPTLLIGDFLLVDKQMPFPEGTHGLLPRVDIHRGDVIVFHYPVEPTMHLVKRVIGIPGDHIRLHDGRVYRNGQLLDEPYAFYRPSAPDGFRDNFPRTQNAEPSVTSHWWIEMHRLIDHGELIIPEGNYFVLGDNRNNSEDSRYWGFVPSTAIVGKPFLIYFSLRQSERNDPPATAQLEEPLHSSGLKENFINHLADFARWDRVLHIVR